MLEGRGRLFLFVMYDEGMDYRDYSANRSDDLENKVRHIHRYQSSLHILYGERHTTEETVCRSLRRGLFQNHHRREPTAIIASLASMLSHIHDYIIQHSISFVKYFHTKSKIGHRSPTVRGGRSIFINAKPCGTTHGSFPTNESIKSKSAIAH